MPGNHIYIIYIYIYIYIYTYVIYNIYKTGAKMCPGADYLLSEDGGSVTMTFLGKFAHLCEGF